MSANFKATIILIFVTMFWGATYFLTKLGLDEIKPFTLISLRFVIAFFVPAFIFYNHISKYDKNIIKYSLSLSVLLFFVFLSMT